MFGCCAGQSVVQIVECGWPREEYAIKFFLTRAAFENEADLYRSGCYAIAPVLFSVYTYVILQTTQLLLASAKLGMHSQIPKLTSYPIPPFQSLGGKRCPCYNLSSSLRGACVATRCLSSTLSIVHFEGCGISRSRSAHRSILEPHEQTCK